MKPFLSAKQRSGLAVAIIIIFSVFVAISSDGDLGQIDDYFGTIVDAMSAVAFGSAPELLAGLWDFLTEMPLVVLVLISGAIYFTFRFDFINLRGVRHAVNVLRGKYDDPNDPGEVSHFQALSTALSATVGLGNIAGVAIAVSIGGPGAVFWMMFAAVFGMASKFAECTLGQMYRKVDEDGVVQGGPMVYLRDGLAEIGRPMLGKYLAVIFAILCIGASFGAGNMFQANQSYSAMTDLVPWLEGERAHGTADLISDQPITIDEPTHRVRLAAPIDDDRTRHYHPLPTHHVDDLGHLEIADDDWTAVDGGLYAVSIEIQARETGPGYNLDAGALATIEVGTVANRDLDWAVHEDIQVQNAAPIDGGVQPRSWLFGILMVILVAIVIVGGIKRIGQVASKIVPAMCLLYVLAASYILLIHYDQIPAATWIIISEAFDPQAGMGGLVGVLIVGIQRAVFSSEAGIGSAAIAHSAAKTKEPVREGFVALLEPAIDTLLVCFMTGSVIVITGVYADPATAGLDDIALTSAAFGTVIGWFPYLLSIAVVLFAFSTMISWSYYGERCWSFLFGVRESMTYRLIFLVFIFLGSVSSLSNVLDFSDLMLLSMAFPNIIGVVLLSGKIRAALISYWDRLHAGDFDHH